MLKDDNLGLGARRNQGDECTGLDALQELLGRLNGKGEDELAQERRIREDARVNKYLHRKLGTVRFVHGGFLVGDKVQELADELQRSKEAAVGVKAETVASDAQGKKSRKSKKRKAEDEEEEEENEEEDGITSEEKKKKEKKEKKAKKRKTEDVEDDSKSKRKEKREKKRKEKDPASEAKVESRSRSVEESKAADDEDDASSRKKSKKDKKERRKKSRDDDEDGSDPQSNKEKKKKKKKADQEEVTNSDKRPGLAAPSSIPSASGTSTPVSEVPHRHLARKRFIAQKRAAVMDPAALNQVRPSVLCDIYDSGF